MYAYGVKNQNGNVNGNVVVIATANVVTITTVVIVVVTAATTTTTPITTTITTTTTSDFLALTDLSESFRAYHHRWPMGRKGKYFGIPSFGSELWPFIVCS